MDPQPQPQQASHQRNVAFDVVMVASCQQSSHLFNNLACNWKHGNKAHTVNILREQADGGNIL
jgi:hypothetical protein